MSGMPPVQAGVSRRSCLALALTALAGCGGGGGGASASLPGTGGTGIYAQGSIAGFGSVIVNAVRYDDTRASVSIDGAGATPVDLRLGMVAEIQGERGTDLSLGTASSIVVWSVAKGRVLQVQSGQFRLPGMTVRTDAGTVWDGVATASALVAGQYVTVWGLQADATGAAWTATRVAVSADASLHVISGVVSVTGTQRSINGITLTDAVVAVTTPPPALSAGQLVRVQGDLSASGTSLQVGSARQIGADLVSVAQGEAEIEGVVTTVLSKTRFTLGAVTVDASSASVSSIAAQLGAGMRVEVKGTWQQGILLASKIEAEDEASIGSVEIEGSIQQFTSLSHFVVRGLVCNAANTPGLTGSTVAKLKVGVKVKIKGTKNGDTVLVTSLKLSD